MKTDKKLTRRVLISPIYILSNKKKYDPSGTAWRDNFEQKNIDGDDWDLTVTDHHLPSLTFNDRQWLSLTINARQWQSLTVTDIPDRHWALMNITDRNWLLLTVTDKHWPPINITKVKILSDNNKGKKNFIFFFLITSMSKSYCSIGLVIKVFE